MIGIDYGRGMTNVNLNTGLRFGVITVHNVAESWYEDSEPVYETDTELGSSDDAVGYKLDEVGIQASQDANSPYVFITSSDFYTFARLCSPRVPGAGDLDNPLIADENLDKENRAYCFGHDFFTNGIAPYRVFRVSDDTEVLPPSQVKTFQVMDIEKVIERDGRNRFAQLRIRWDDECKNGHNTFSMVISVWNNESKTHLHECGQCPEIIKKYFPEHWKYYKWHLMGSDSPMHYIENTMYWLGHRGWCDGKKNSPPNYDYARKTAIWPELTDEEIKTTSPEEMEKKLKARLPNLMKDFRNAILELGFEW